MKPFLEYKFIQCKLILYTHF